MWREDKLDLRIIPQPLTKVSTIVSANTPTWSWRRPTRGFGLVRERPLPTSIFVPDICSVIDAMNDPRRGQVASYIVTARWSVQLQNPEMKTHQEGCDSVQMVSSAFFFESFGKFGFEQLTKKWGKGHLSESSQAILSLAKKKGQINVHLFASGHQRIYGIYLKLNLTKPNSELQQKLLKEGPSSATRRH